MACLRLAEYTDYHSSVGSEPTTRLRLCATLCRFGRRAAVEANTSNTNGVSLRPDLPGCPKAANCPDEYMTMADLRLNLIVAPLPGVRGTGAVGRYNGSRAVGHLACTLVRRS